MSSRSHKRRLSTPRATSIPAPSQHATCEPTHGRTDPHVRDAVNHPPHYNRHPAGIECIDVVEHLSFNLGNAIKYLWRAGDKGDLDQDLRKAIWYIERERTRLGGGQ